MAEKREGVSGARRELTWSSKALRSSTMWLITPFSTPGLAELALSVVRESAESLKRAFRGVVWGVKREWRPAGAAGEELNEDV